MPGPPYFLLFEILAYIQLALCLAHALRRGTPSLVRIAFAAVFGIFLELVLLREPGTFKYGSFFLMIGDVPLCVGLAWGACFMRPSSLRKRAISPAGRGRCWTDCLPFTGQRLGVHLPGSLTSRDERHPLK